MGVKGVGFFQNCLVGGVFNKWKWVVKLEKICNQAPLLFVARVFDLLNMSYGIGIYTHSSTKEKSISILTAKLKLYDTHVSLMT